MSFVRTKFGPIEMSYRPRTWDHGIIREVLAAYPLDRCKITGDRPVIIDVGAHIGTFAALCHHRWPSADIVAVEPDPGNFEVLRENVGPDTALYRAAVGDPSLGTIRVIRYKESAAHAPNPGQSADAWGRNTGGSYTAASTGGMRADMEDAGEAPIYTLGSLCSNAIIDILKLDCEGAEVDALRHAGIPMKNIRYILGEVHGPELQEGLQQLLAETHRVEFTKPGAVLSEFFAEPLP